MTGTRRDVLLAGSSLTLASVAGCLGTFGSDDDRWAYASFFTLYDFTRNIVDPGQSVENAVPSGQHGHEWQPSMDMLPNIVESDVFIYLGTDGFQPWVDDALEQLDRNHGDAVALIDALSGIELLEYDGHGNDDSHDHGGHGHSHGEYDAKFFSDPMMAQAGVRTIRDRLIELDPENETIYEENAAAYLEKLEALHERFEEALSDREHDHVVLASHDSFQYLAERYGFEIHTPVGLSPNDSPSGGEIAAAVEFVEEHGIEYVLWDYFDGDELAETIATEADTVTDTVMVSPAESAAEEWNEAGHGDYLGQMAEINLPAFRTALGAE